MQTVSTSKEELRTFMLERRKKMDIKEVHKKSRDIIETFLSIYKHYKSFLLYFSFNNEVKTFDLINNLLDSGKSVYSPKIYGVDLLPAKVTEINSLKPNKYGILEPVEFTDISEFDVVVTPGIVFDKSCNRIGFGAGYYDKLLPKIKARHLVGFAYDFQVVDFFKTEKFDVPMDEVITENNIYRRN